jgi:hypothetical protein
VIFLTSKDDELDEALGWRWGRTITSPSPFPAAADRAHPCDPAPSEASGQVQGTTAAEVQGPLTRGALAMDPARHKVTWKDEPVTLTVTEFLILETLAQRPGIVRTRNQLMDAAYHDDVYVDDRTIDSHIKRLRRKFRRRPDFRHRDALWRGLQLLRRVKPPTWPCAGRARSRPSGSGAQHHCPVAAGGRVLLPRPLSHPAARQPGGAGMREVRLVGEALSSVRPGERDALMMRIAKDTGGGAAL